MAIAVWQRVFWAVLVGIVGSVLSLVGGLTALQTMTIVSALPFSLVLIAACFGFIKALRVETAKKDSLQIQNSSQSNTNFAENWQDKLDNILSTPDKKNADVFINTKVKQAFVKVKLQLEDNNINAAIIESEKGLVLQVHHGDEHDFIYGVHKKSHTQPEFTSSEANLSNESYYRAEVHLTEGGQKWQSSMILSTNTKSICTFYIC